MCVSASRLRRAWYIMSFRLVVSGFAKGQQKYVFEVQTLNLRTKTFLKDEYLHRNLVFQDATP